MKKNKSRTDDPFGFKKAILHKGPVKSYRIFAKRPNGTIGIAFLEGMRKGRIEPF